MNKYVETRRPIDGALLMFDLGFKLFPCKPNTKEPAFDGWQEWARNASRKRILDFGTAQPTCNWAVFPEASGHSVIDLDVKHGNNGIQELNALEQLNEPLPHTLTVNTPSTGIHHYYKGTIRSTIGTVAPGIDTKSRGGYVLAPGSRIDDRAYEIITMPEHNEIPVMPGWFERLTEKKGPAETVPEIIETGERNKTLASFAGTMRRRGANYDTILAALTAMNESQLDDPLPEAEVQHIAQQIAQYAPEHAEAASDFLNTEPFTIQSYKDIDYTAIPKRDWIMAQRYVGGFISGVVAPGGVGKSTLTMLDAISIATGQPLTGFEVVKRGNVWLYNTEDPAAELHRRLAAMAQLHGIKYNEQDFEVFISSGQDKPFIIAKSNNEGVSINKTLIDDTVDEIRRRGIVLLICDPFVRTHECKENANEDIDKVVWCFSRIAARTGCAICLVHHTSKTGSRPQGSDETIDMYSSRGATALINAARVCHVLRGMTKQEAKRFRIEEKKKGWYMRLDNAKANLQPPAEAALWFEKHSVTLINGDDVGAIKLAEIKDSISARAQEALDTDRADLGRAFDSLFARHDALSLADVSSTLVGHSDYAHLFDSVDSERGMRKKLKVLLEYPLDTDDYTYSMVDEQGKGKRFKITKIAKLGGYLAQDLSIDALLQ